MGEDYKPATAKKQKVPVQDDDRIGLPDYKLVYRYPPQDSNQLSWEDMQDVVSMNWNVVMYPFLEGDILQTIYINMDSRVLLDYKGGKRNLSLEQNQFADRRYITSVYFHALFLYAINRNRRYFISQDIDGQIKDIDLADYLEDIFANYYADFLLNFETGELMEGLA